MQRGIAQDLTLMHRQQRQVAAQIDILTPIVNNARLGDAVFDEHAFLMRHRQKEFVEGHFVAGFERAHDALQFVLQLHLFGILSQGCLDQHGVPPWVVRQINRAARSLLNGFST
jgi:hypothetical protein